MKKLIAISIVLPVLMTTQLMFASIAQAAGNNNMSLHSSWTYGDGGTEFSICNNGATDIKEAHVAFSSTNYQIDAIHAFTIAIDNALGSDPGTYNETTGIWTGLVEPTKCIKLYVFGQPTGNLGDSMTITMDLLSTTEVDNSVETYTGISTTTNPYIYIEPADITSQARLMTTGAVNAGDPISYQIDVTNQGPGTLMGTNDFFLFVLALPADTTFVDMQDLNPADNLIVNNANCSPAGTFAMFELSGMEAYNDRNLIFCFLSTTDGTLVAGNTIYSFQANLSAGASLAAGDSDVIGILEAKDRGTADIVRTALDGTNVFTHDINNITYLQYDPNALQMTASLCPGQSETTTDGTGCFRLSFNKRVYGPSFLSSYLDLGGVGHITGFEQLDDFTWEVNVAGIAPGQTLTLLLKDDNEILDYSAVLANTQVLGINTIRFASTSPSGNSSGTPSNSASGTLPSTGTNGDLTFYAMILLTIGIALFWRFDLTQRTNRSHD